jgi:PPM family protein phosphatase
MIRLRAGTATDPGRIRSNNQDRVLVVDDVLFAVADGMGGHRGGEVAAQIVTDGLAGAATSTIATDEGTAPPRDLTTPPRGLASTTILGHLEDLNAEILHRAAMSDDLLGMGTTLTMLARSDKPAADGSAIPLLLVANIGDSRTYLLRNGELEQLTEDHSVVSDLIRAGEITRDQARTHRQRSVITRALGVDGAVEPDFLEIIPAPGSRYLLCSDGLSTEVPDQVIGAILRRLSDPDEAARELVRVALERGGRDNISVIVVDVTDDSGHDHLALAASNSVTSTRATPALASTPDASGQAPTKHKGKQGTKRPKGPRRPRPVNLRVILFLAMLAALGTLVYAVLKNAPATEPSPITSPTTVVDVVGGAIVAVVPTTTPFVGPTTSIDDFAPGTATTSAASGPTTTTRKP